jgi:hypothetical protein
MFPDFAPDYATTPGSYYAGIRVPFSAGGMVNGQAQYLNEFGATNTGFHLKSNSLKYFITGSEWAINDDRTWIIITTSQTCPLVIGVDRVYLTGTGVVGYDNVEAVVEAKPRADQIQLPIAFISTATGTLNTDSSSIIFREGAPSVGGGSSILSSGRPMVVEARAYLNNSGTVYGNSMFRWRAPRSGTAINETANGGAFAVLPGNSSDNTVHFFLGSAITSVDLTGDAASIQALSTGKIELRENGSTNWFYGSTTPWASLSRTSNSFFTWSQDGASRFYYANENTGTAASANIEVRQSVSSLQTAVRMTVYSTGYTPSGIAFADGGAVYSDNLLSGGLSVAALAGPLRLAAGTGSRIYAMSDIDVGNRVAAVRTEAFHAARTLDSGTDPTGAFSSQDRLALAGEAYIAFDDRSIVNGTINIAFHKSFQSRPIFTQTGTASSMDGFSSEPDLSFTGTVTSGAGFTSQVKGTNVASVISHYRHFYVLDDDDYDGTFTNQYGLYIDTLTKGTTSDWAIWTVSNPVHLGGALEVGSTSISFLNGLPAADPGIPGRLYHTAGAVMISL